MTKPNDIRKASRMELMNEFLKAYEALGSQAKAAKKIGITLSRVRGWRDRGKRGDEDYKDWYEQLLKVKPIRVQHKNHGKPGWFGLTD